MTVPGGGSTGNRDPKYGHPLTEHELSFAERAGEVPDGGSTREFPRRDTASICADLYAVRPYPRDLLRAELALQWLYMEEAGEVAYCPPRAGIDIRRDIRQARIRLRILRKRVAS